ncbi:MAG: hypothetical protein ABSC30_06965 [Acidimicrobiales bacterium]
MEVKPTSLSLAKILVGLGFILVGVGPLPLFLALSSEFPGSENFYWIVTAFGYALLGVASWAWLNNLFKTKDAYPGMRLVLWLVALACLVLGVAYLGLFNELIEAHRHPHVGLRRQGVSDLLSMIGFCLTALGFWIAGRVVGSDEGSQQASGKPTPIATTSGGSGHAYSGIWCTAKTDAPARHLVG